MAGNIRRFWRSSLGDSFSRDLLTRYRLRDSTKMGRNEPIFGSRNGRWNEPPWQPSLKPGPRFRVDRFYRSRRCPTRCSPTMPS